MISLKNLQKFCTELFSQSLAHFNILLLTHICGLLMLGVTLTE